MPNSYTRIHYSEDLPIFSGDFEPSVGTETLTGVYVSLQDAQDRVVSSISAIAATGFVQTASAEPYAWHVIGPKRTGLPVPGFQDCYSLWFLAVDTNGNTYQSVQGILVRKDGN